MRDADQREELRALADARFAKADNINQVNPMTWVGRGMLNLAQNKLDQARFFFENLTLRECGETLPALIGMAAVKFLERDYAGALDLYRRLATPRLPALPVAAAADPQLAGEAIAADDLNGILQPVQLLEIDVLGVARPFHARDVVISRIGVGVKPLSFSAVGRDDAHAAG